MPPKGKGKKSTAPASAATVAQDDRRVWDTSKAASCEGKFEGWVKGRFGVLLKLDTAYVKLTTVVSNTLEPVARSLRPGDKIRVDYTGLNKRTKLFDVYVNGKKLEQRFTFTDVTVDDVFPFQN